MKRKTRILLYDIETSYTVGATWGLYEQNVVKVLIDPYILSVSWKWLGEKTTHVVSLPDFPLFKKDKKNDRDLVKVMWKLFDDADIIIAHNGNSFDQKWTYARFLVNGMTPPSPSIYIDTKLVAKSKFRFNSNSLNNLAGYFGIGEKIHTDIDLWVGCIERNELSSWHKMCKYNKRDVVLLEKVYLKMLPYITNHPNLNLFGETLTSCPNCGSDDLQKRGHSYTRTSKNERLKCNGCGSWHIGSRIKLNGIVVR